MAEGVKPTESDIEVARFGTMFQLKNNSGFNKLCNDGESIDDALLRLNLNEFIENTVMVKASMAAIMRMQQEVIHKMTEEVAELKFILEGLRK